MTEKITDRLVRDLAAPAKGNRIAYDTEVKGFGVRITAAGAKSFIINYYVDGRERRLTIGSYPDWTIFAARNEAKALKMEIDRGNDPLAKRVGDREAPTVSDLWDAYREKHLPTKRKRSADDDAGMWRTYILPRFRNIKVAALTAEQIDDMHRQIGTDKPVRANRVVEVLSKALNLAKRWEWIDRNVAEGVQSYPENQRKRYATPAEMMKVFDALAAHRQQTSCDAIRLAVLTGARIGEIKMARWRDIDLDGGTWTKPSAHTKQAKDHRVPLSGAATDLLARRREAAGGGEWVFPARTGDGHLVDVKRTWDAVRRSATLALWAEDARLSGPVADLRTALGRIPTVEEVAAAAERSKLAVPQGLTDLRIHDLRHTFASLLASRKTPLQVVGALLGHTQAQTTLRYAHLYDDPMREGAEIAATLVGGRPPGGS